MSAFPYASDDKIQQALTAIGAGAVSTVTQTLLQQILVAVATSSRGGGGGGATAWGSITGTLSAQADLQAALNAKAGLTTNTFSGTQTFPVWTDGSNFLFKWLTDRVLARNAADSGDATFQAGILVAIGSIFGGSLTVQSGVNLDGGNVNILNSANGVNWNNDTFLLRNGGANSLQQGLTSATPADQLFKGPNGSGSNIQGGDLRIGPGQSTGNATPAEVVIQATQVEASGTTPQTLLDYFSVSTFGTKILNGNFQLAVSAASEGITPSHTLIVYDGTGTPYKIACVPA